MLVPLLLISAVSIEAASAAAQALHGRGPAAWWFFHPRQCDALIFPMQSPVVLNAESAVRTRLPPSTSGPMITMVAPPGVATLTNDGQTLLLLPDYGSQEVRLELEIYSSKI